MTDTCKICEKALDDGRTVQRDIEGGGAHCECLDAIETDEGDDDD